MICVKIVYVGNIPDRCVVNLINNNMATKKKPAKKKGKC
jgi:hypothetical protein